MMERPYKDQPKKEVKYFIGKEVEQTPAYGMKTLFVVGLQNVKNIYEMCKVKNIKHVYVGANHSFYESEDNHPSADEWAQHFVIPLLNARLLVTWDFQASQYEQVSHNMGHMMEHSSFIPMVSVLLPWVHKAPYNTIVKLDDHGIGAANPGVWCHRLDDLMDYDAFTPWHAYTDDEAL